MERNGSRDSGGTLSCCDPVEGDFGWSMSTPVT